MDPRDSGWPRGQAKPAVPHPLQATLLAETRPTELSPIYHLRSYMCTIERQTTYNLTVIHKYYDDSLSQTWVQLIYGMEPSI